VSIYPPTFNRSAVSNPARLGGPEDAAVSRAKLRKQQAEQAAWDADWPAMLPWLAEHGCFGDKGRNAYATWQRLAVAQADSRRQAAAARARYDRLNAALDEQLTAALAAGTPLPTGAELIEAAGAVQAADEVARRLGGGAVPTGITARWNRCINTADWPAVLEAARTLAADGVDGGDKAVAWVGWYCDQLGLAKRPEASSYGY
jgi:hypothetical protein